jgi:outer membrane protein assembly factor BamB
MCRALVERLGTGILGSPAVANGIVYVDNANGVFALDARTGAERWVYRSGDGDNGSPSVVDGTLYFGSSGLIALNAATGQYKWRHDTGGYIDLSSPAVANGTVYIGATDGNVYAITPTLVRFAGPTRRRGTSNLRPPSRVALTSLAAMTVESGIAR